ncbi:hypothetical protein [Nostocoides australiense]
MDEQTERLRLEIMLEIVRVIGASPRERTQPNTTLADILGNLPDGVHIETIIGAIIGPKEVTLGDSYEVGQAGAVGPNSVGVGNTFSQIWLDRGAEIDLPELAKEIAAVRGAVRKSGRGELEQDEALGALASAERAAADGDGPGALGHLRQAGTWVLDVAKQIGVPVAIKAIGAALGIPT